MMSTSHETGVLLQKVITSMSNSFDMQLIDLYHHLSPPNIDQLVQMEMKRLRDNYRADEERYVQQMLTENPVVVVERRAAVAHNDSQCVRQAVAVPSTNSSGEQQQRLQQQRSESCRKSRVNNKIKKAKTKFRHKYAAYKLSQSTNVLKCLQDVIAQTEAQLLGSGGGGGGGGNQMAIQRLRNIYGLQRRAVSASSEVIEVD